MFNLNKIRVLDFFIVLFLILIGAFSRLLPHPPNFTPIAAIALFGGVYFSKKTALILPLAAVIISDIFIGYYNIGLMISVYLIFLLVVILGFWLKKNKKWYTILGSSLSASVLFFILTNFAVWVFTVWYPKNIPGLTECYLMALPFFKNTLLGDMIYVFLFFGVYEAIRILIKKKLEILEKSPQY